MVFFCQAEDGIRDLVRSRGLGDVYKRQVAVDCAREGANQNVFGPELELICGTLSDVAAGMKPDLVVANIDRQTLLLLSLIHI